jgi:hypothetical protein
LAAYQDSLAAEIGPLASRIEVDPHKPRRQDEPGQSPGVALTAKILDPQSPHAKPFIGWFRDLYQL